MQYSAFGNTGLRVSRLGLGGAPLGGDFGPTDEAEIERMIHGALELGVNVIDTAPLYGNGKSERRIGRALQGGRRERVVLASKAVQTGHSYSYASTIQSVEASLNRLRTDWLDIVQIHDAEQISWDVIESETVPALQKLRMEGKIRFIGISTVDLPLLMRYMKTGLFDCVLSYARYMLLDHTAKDEALPLAKELGIGFMNGSVLGMGLLSDTPARFLPETLVQEAQRRIEHLQFLRPGGGSGGLIEPAMRFSLSHPDIHVTLTGTTTLRDLQTNVSYCDGAGLRENELREVYRLFDRQPLFY